jgi:homocysteine S-methyltransferase
MGRYLTLMDRIEAGEQVFIDGATGTEIERRGVPQLDNAWNGGGALSHPEILRVVHEDYIRAGAEILISNTFATLRSALRDAGVEKDFDAYNRRGVELACEARAALGANAVVVAGGISHWSWSGNHPILEELRDNATEQAAIMKDAGADLIMLEMMSKVEPMLAVLDGVQGCGLPVWVGLSCKLDSNGTPRLYDSDNTIGEQTLADAIDALNGRNVPLISIMHTEVSYVDACLDVVEKMWAGPVGVYAHSGNYVGGKWVFNSVITPVDYAAAAEGWRNRGVRVIGGCCGVGPIHIRALTTKGS